MKQYLALIVGAYLALTSSPSSKLDVNDNEWISYKSQYNKSYESDEVELMRRSIFAFNKQRIEDFNSKNGRENRFSLGLSHLTDLSDFEIKTFMNGYKSSGDVARGNTPEAERFLNDILNDNSIEVPDEVDWRKVPGRVSSVKDQGMCGSCWAFSAVGALEGQEKSRLSNGLESNFSLIDLSPQNLVDCSKANHGCDGGQMSLAFDFVKQENGIDDLESYPYSSEDDECQFEKDKVVMSDSGYVLLPEADEEKLKEVIAKFGPVSVAIDASSESFMHYKSGVLHDDVCSPTNLDHGVLAVGYGTDPVGGDYWLVKNSWTEEWGDRGYVKMARNKDNQCGIATAAVIPKF